MLYVDSQLAVETEGAFAQLCLVHQLQPYLGCADLVTTIKTLVISHLGYCSLLYVGAALEE